MIKIQAIQIFFSRLSKREQSILYVAIFLISLMLIDRFIIGPVFLKINTLDNEIREKESAIRRNTHILSQKDRISSEVSGFSDFLKPPKPEQEELTSFLKEVEGLADKSSVYLIDMKPSGVKDLGSHKKYSIVLNCEAQMEQIINFIYSIENAPGLYLIEKYQISPKSKETSVAKCNVSISKIVIQ